MTFCCRVFISVLLSTIDVSNLLIKYEETCLDAVPVIVVIIVVFVF